MKNKYLQNKVDNLKRRAEIYRKIRRFFYERNCWECETPVLASRPCVEEHIDSFKTCEDGNENPSYLIASPEYFMKRLVAAGGGNCFQITKSFRRGEIGDLHNPEFTLLEWYRVGFDHHDLIAETASLLEAVLGVEGHQTIAYATAFRDFAGIDVFNVTHEALRACPQLPDEFLRRKPFDQEAALDFLFSFVVQPELGKERPVFVTDFPRDQAALARHNDDGLTAARFEGFFRGIELCNGYFEITEAEDLESRLARINAGRLRRGVGAYPIDEALVESFRDCDIGKYAGVALGLDRLVMLALGSESVREVLAFPFGEH